MKIEYTITSQDVRDCGATQQIRYDCLFQSGIESEEAFYDVEAKARAKNIIVGVGWGVLLAKKQFRDNDTSGEGQSHREDDGASPMWADFPPATCEDILVCLSIKACLKNGF